MFVSTRHLPIIALCLWLFALASSQAVSADTLEAPFGDKISAVKNYNRATPFVGTGGLIGDGGIGELTAAGIRTIIDLRGPDEGTAEERKSVEAAGLTYLNIPVMNKAPTDAEVTAFGEMIADGALYPVLVHCTSANRAGAMWTLYRAGKGVPFDIALQEGRTIGLKPNREAAVRARLGQPPLSDD